MADGIEVKITGLDELEEKLKPFASNSLALRRIITRASRAGMKSTRDKVVASAKALDDSGTVNRIWKNVYTKVNSKHFNSRGYIVAKVGIRGGAKAPLKDKEKDKDKDKEAITTGAPGGDTFYWRFLEFGTSHQKAKPFMRPAFNTVEIESEFTKSVEAAIMKEIKKYGTPKSK